MGEEFLAKELYCSTNYSCLDLYTYARIKVNLRDSTRNELEGERAVKDQFLRVHEVAMRVRKDVSSIRRAIAALSELVDRRSQSSAG